MVRVLAVLLLLGGCTIPLDVATPLELSISPYPSVIQAGDAIKVLIEAKGDSLETNIMADDDVSVNERIGSSFVDLTLATSKESQGLKEVRVELLSGNRVGVAVIGFEVVPRD